MRTKFTTIGLLVSLSALVTAGCGQLQNQGQSPSQVSISSLVAAGSGRNFLLSDVMDHKLNIISDDAGQVAMTLRLKDPGTAGLPNTPSALNDVTFTRYHVVYRRTDGHNLPGVDVPYAFDSAATFTVGSTGGAATFELVRHVAKEEAPLATLRSSAVVITTLADVTFYGRDQAGNDVAVTGSIQISFGDFPDP